MVCDGGVREHLRCSRFETDSEILVDSLEIPKQSSLEVAVILADTERRAGRGIYYLA